MEDNSKRKKEHYSKIMFDTSKTPTERRRRLKKFIARSVPRSRKTRISNRRANPTIKETKIDYTYVFPIDPTTGIRVLPRLSSRSISDGHINWFPVRTGERRKKQTPRIRHMPDGRRMLRKYGRCPDTKTVLGKKSTINQIMEAAESVVDNLQEEQKALRTCTRRTKIKGQ